MKPKVINNTMLIDNCYLSDFEKHSQEYLAKHFSGTNFLQIEDDLKFMLGKLSLEDVVKLVQTELGNDTLRISFIKELNAHVAFFTDHGFHDNEATMTSVMVAIHKAYCNLKRAQKLAKYLKVLGYGLHREFLEED